MAEETTYQFKAEIRHLLDILVHSLYKEREIFLRELISNASDALTRLQFEMLTNPDVLDPEAELAIHIDVVGEEDDEKTLVIKDFEVKSYLLVSTAGRASSRHDTDHRETSTDPNETHLELTAPNPARG